MTALLYSFLHLERISCSIQGSNCCFLTHIQVSQETGKMVWYFHLSKSFPQLVMIHTVKGFSIVSETEIDVFLKFPCFLYKSSKCWQIYTYTYIPSFGIHLGFPGGSVVKNRSINAGNAGDMGLVPGLGRSPGGGNGTPLQYSCLENRHGERSLVGYRP